MDLYGDHSFRLLQDNSGEGMRAPEAKPQAKILAADARKGVSELSISEKGNELTVSTGRINIVFDKSTSLFKVINRQTNTVALQATELPVFE